MNDIFYSSKDEIRNRVLKNAQDYWGIKNTADFDPLVKLLIEALSTELFNISNEVDNLQNRMVDKLSGILAPDTLISAVPAHAVLHARPIEATEIIDEKEQFFYGKRLTGKEGDSREATADIFFSPLQPVKIFDAAVTHMATGGNLFQIDDQQHKLLVAQSKNSQQLERNAVYLGLSISSDITSLDGLNVYFDWKSYKVDKQTYDLLSFAEWSIDDIHLDVSQDSVYDVPGQQSVSPFYEHNILNLVTRDVYAFYRNRLFTLQTNNLLPAAHLQLYPPVFETVFPASNLEGLKGPLLWIKIVVPVTITQSILNELSVVINAFPIVNKRRHDLKHRLKMMNDIIPLRLSDQDQFLCVQTLKDNAGNHYTEIPQGYEEDRSAGLFSVRYGGAERFDKRNAREILDYLFELLRDEKAAFAAYGSDFLNTALKELEQNISMIAQKTTRQLNSIRELLSYIVFKPLEDADIMFLEFWTTNAELGNNIRTGSRLLPFESTRIAADSLFLLSSTQGGRSRLNAVNRVRAYKYGLTTGDRVVTHMDIVNFCYWEFGSNITDVKIKKGLMNSMHPKEGFVRTVDVMLTPAPGNGLKPEEWQSLLELAHSKLSSRSIMNLHYRLLLTSGNNSVI
ncbi:type VI secretion system baseplate subunit TssF [Chitinophaga sp. S165]|uniref:type VI secretion system baseplate subunit TssF n=1 Tax=Chitinophaga sp. S165 TaxID=2135462 RepID=UPI000D71C375|nr:type VI secretion system baseplate subunit TssF [Chitinophaga sp. S165]PWV56564.1 hypothetical protein C7475_1011081 [Chitinophaga sp. S165]